MMKTISAKAEQKRRAKGIEAAQSYLNRGCDRKRICEALFNNFSFFSEFKGDTLIVCVLPSANERMVRIAELQKQ